jgi:nucleotide-binding universal stress UspA family protein
MQLSSDFDAHLTALYAYIPSLYDYRFAGFETINGLERLLRKEEEQAQENSVTFREKFESQAERFGSLKTGWCFLNGERELAQVLALHARYADVVIMGQHDPNNAPPVGGCDTPAQVALMSGRPVLVVPHAGSFNVIGSHVVIAWNATREAVRAVTAALPLLIRAESVDIVVVGEGKRMTSSYGDGPGSDISLYLARHGVKSTVLRISRGGLYVSEALQSVMVDQGADLLCMGAYGHSRLRELVLGGVTHDIMRHMTLPTLIAC